MAGPPFCPIIQNSPARGPGGPWNRPLLRQCAPTVSRAQARRVSPPGGSRATWAGRCRAAAAPQAHAALTGLGGTACPWARAGSARRLAAAAAPACRSPRAGPRSGCLHPASAGPGAPCPISVARGNCTPRGGVPRPGSYPLSSVSACESHCPPTLEGDSGDSGGSGWHSVTVVAAVRPRCICPRRFPSGRERAEKMPVTLPLALNTPGSHLGEASQLVSVAPRRRSVSSLRSTSCVGRPPGVAKFPTHSPVRGLTGIPTLHPGAEAEAPTAMLWGKPTGPPPPPTRPPPPARCVEPEARPVAPFTLEMPGPALQPKSPGPASRWIRPLECGAKASQPDRSAKVLGACPLLGERQGTAPLPKPPTGVTAVALPEGGGEAEPCTKAAGIATRPLCVLRLLLHPWAGASRGQDPRSQPASPPSPHTCPGAMTLSPQTRRGNFLCFPLTHWLSRQKHVLLQWVESTELTETPEFLI